MPHWLYAPYARSIPILPFWTNSDVNLINRKPFILYRSLKISTTPKNLQLMEYQSTHYPNIFILNAFISNVAVYFFFVDVLKYHINLYTINKNFQNDLSSQVVV